MVKCLPYLLTGGLVPLIENRHKFNLNNSTKDLLRKIEFCYFMDIKNLLGGFQEKDEEGKPKFYWDVQFISDTSIEEKLGMLLKKRSSNNPLISFDDVYCQNFPQGNYHVTRIQNPNNLSQPPKTGSRYCSLGLKDQVNAIRKEFGEKIDIMDIGIFGGDTLFEEIKRLREGNVNVECAYVMFAGQEGINRFSNSGLKLNYFQEMNWIDWIEIRDCMGFDGRKVKVKDKEELSKNMFVRYFERPNKWASIPLQFEEYYKILYRKYFNLTKDILNEEGIKVSLNPSRKNRIIYELKMSQTKKKIK
jgi:hypothetical protein